MVLLPGRNGTYVIPVRSNGKFLPVLTTLTRNGTNENVQRLVLNVKSKVNKGTEPQKQVILVPVLIDARMFQAALAQSHGFESLVGERPRGVRDVVFCFTNRGTEMCVRTDLSAGRVTALARRLKEKGKNKRKLRSRKKGKRHRKMFRSWKDALKEIFWPRNGEHGPLPASLKDTMDIFTFKNLTLWRSLRWERVVNATGLGTDVSASDKLKHMLQNPPEKNVTAQAVNDILLLHELLDLTSWATDKKWKSFEKGCQLLVTRETASESPMRDRQITESGWGPGIDPPNILLPTQSEKASAVDMNSDEVKKNPDWDLLQVNKAKPMATNKYKSASERRTSRKNVHDSKRKWKRSRGKGLAYDDIYALMNHSGGQRSRGIWLGDQSAAYANHDNAKYKTLQTTSQKFTVDEHWLNPKEMNELFENIKLFGTTSKRLVLFAQTVSLATSQSEHGWKLLTLGFNMFSKKTHITEKEMIDVIAKLPGPTFGIHFQETINSMIVYDLVMFNGTSEYEAWMRMQWRRFTIIAAPAFSQEVQNQLSTAGSLKPMDDLYVVQLDQLIMMKLSMLSLNASYSEDIDALLSKNLDAGVTPEFLKDQKDFLGKNNVSAKILEDVYYNDLIATTLSSLIYVNNLNGTCAEASGNLQHISPKNANNTEVLAQEVDAIIDKVKEMNITNIGDMCIKELFFLKLLTMANYQEHEVVWRDIIVMKWANMSDMEGDTGETFSQETVLVLKDYIHTKESFVVNSLQEQIKSFVQKDNLTEEAEAAMREKLIKALKNGNSQLRKNHSSDTVVLFPESEDSEENHSDRGQQSGPGAHPVVIVPEGDDSDNSSQYTAATIPAAEQTKMSAEDEIAETMTTEKVTTVVIKTVGSLQDIAARSIVSIDDATAGTPPSQ